MVPMLEACPADVLKDAVVNILKAVLGMIDDLKSVVEEYSKLFEEVSCVLLKKTVNYMKSYQVYCQGINTSSINTVVEEYTVESMKTSRVSC